MYNLQYHEYIKTVLLSQRMISIRNLTSLLMTDVPTISRALSDLEQKGYLRIAQPKGCHSTCSTVGNNKLTEATTIISLLYTREDGHVDHCSAKILT